MSDAVDGSMEPAGAQGRYLARGISAGSESYGPTGLTRPPELRYFPVACFPTHRHPFMRFPCYNSPAHAMAATDEFYWAQEGFEYPEAKVTEWLRAYLVLPSQGRVLDLCCGDGIWSKGMQNVQPKLELLGSICRRVACAKRSDCSKRITIISSSAMPS